MLRLCPFGQPGDRLWVRETWQGPLVDDFESYRANPDEFKNSGFCEYAADGGATPEFITEDDVLVQRWRPSIHMPRWASRINLEITGVRVERLNNISEDDAKAEGIGGLSAYKNKPAMWRDYSFPVDGAGGMLFPESDDHSAPVLSYKSLWEFINSPGSWDTNPWVWVVEFRRMT